MEAERTAHQAAAAAGATGMAAATTAEATGPAHSSALQIGPPMGTYYDSVVPMCNYHSRQCLTSRMGQQGGWNAVPQRRSRRRPYCTAQTDLRYLQCQISIRACTPHRSSCDTQVRGLCTGKPSDRWVRHLCGASLGLGHRRMLHIGLQLHARNIVEPIAAVSAAPRGVRSPCLACHAMCWLWFCPFCCPAAPSMPVSLILTAPMPLSRSLQSPDIRT